MPVLTVEVVDQLGVRLPAGGPGHGPGEEQPHERERQGQRAAHPTHSGSGLRSGNSKLGLRQAPRIHLSSS